MPRPDLIALILLFAVLTPALWQQEPETSLRDWLEIDAVSVSADSKLRISGHFAQDCAGQPTAEIMSFPHNLDIQVYRQRSSRALCSLRRQAASVDIDIKVYAAASPPALLVNHGAWARTGDGSSYEPIALHPAYIESAGLSGDATGELRLKLRGAQAIGCDLPELYSLRKGDERISIQVSNALAADLVCPAALVDIEATVSLGATEMPPSALFEVNGVPITELERQAVSSHDKVLTNILRVDIRVMESYPMQISLDVQGEHPDGCDLPVRVRQSRAGSTARVEVYREVPADMICPMILRPYRENIMLEGGFESGSYTIEVNSHSQQLEL